MRGRVALALALLATGALGQIPENGLLKLGGFRCVDLRPYANDNYFDLYQTAFWSNASFRMDVWKRLGVPYWWPQGAGNIRVAGKDWRRPASDVVSDIPNGGVATADSQQPGNGSVRSANDDDPTTYWYAGDNHPSGSLLVTLGKPRRVKEVRFLGWDTGRHAPRDYQIGLILPNGSRRVLADVKGEKRMGEWIAFPVSNIEASAIFLNVSRTIEGAHGPVIYELQARGDQPASTIGAPEEVVIPLKGQTAEEACFLGQVGGGFNTAPNAYTDVGEYRFTYENGQTETVPLTAGDNVASTRYGHFVSGADFAWGLRDKNAMLEPGAAKLSFHLCELRQIERKKQLMVFSHSLNHKDWPLKELRFTCTNPKAFLILQALTLRQSGPRMNILTYNGHQLNPTPASAPPGGPSWREAHRDPARTIRLDGLWEYGTDPANLGMLAKAFELRRQGREPKTMPVPSQWYVQGLDYHGVVWFRRSFFVPANFPGKRMELHFERVDYDARVWVNGVFVGRHIGAYSSFALDATKAIKKGVQNRIVVRVDSPIDPGFAGHKTLAKGNAMDDIAMPYAEEGSMGGIYRSVFLVGRDQPVLRDVWTSSKVAPDLSSATVTVHFARDPDEPTPVRFSLFDRDGHAVAARVTPSHDQIVLTVSRPKLWWPWEQGKPNLYTLRTEILVGDDVIDRQVCRFGIKEVEHNAKENCLYVNHHRIFLKGMLNDDCHWQSLMDRRAYRYRIQMQKDANLNIIRLTTHQSSPEFYELCDEMGMMVWQEMPLQWTYSSSPAVRNDIRQIVRETVTQTRPHPCVVGYSAWNEGGQFGFTDELVALMRSLDSTRPISRANGGGDFDTHVYPTQWESLTRRTPLWSGLTFNFISETGAYGISDLKNLRAMFGNDLFRYDGAEYFWETFASYRHVDGPAYMESPPPLEWPTEKIRSYVFDRVDNSERFFWQAMKSMFEVSRAQRFAPTTSLIYCRFDDPFPTAFLGIMNFVGQPLKAYYGAKEACQQVLPILMFDPRGASDVRVVNDYWFRSWTGCTLNYTLKSYDGQVIKEVRRSFDLPADATVKVLNRTDLGDLWHARGGIKADLSVTSGDGKVLSQNHYDLTAEEVHTFVTSVYPTAPDIPVDAVVATADRQNGVRVPADGAYGTWLDALGERGIGAEFAFEVPEDGLYTIRPACSSGPGIHHYNLLVDGHKAELESYAGLNRDERISRKTYTVYNLAWYPGWTARLTKGFHSVSIAPAPGARTVLIDAIAVQKR